jgi:NADPH2:quinone reductase
MPQYVQGASIPIATGALFDAIRRGLFDDLDVDRYPFDDIVRAHENLEGRRRHGLPVLTI